VSLEGLICQLGSITLPFLLAWLMSWRRPDLKDSTCGQVMLGRVSQPCALVQNFWQRYASYATAAPEACVANKGHAGGSVAKLCFLIGKIILPVTTGDRAGEDGGREKQNNDVENQSAQVLEASI